jgi:LemA protein
VTLELLSIVAARKHTPRPPAPPPEVFPSPGVPWALILILVGGVALVGLIGYLSYLSTKRRRLGFQTMARQLGLSYSLDDPFGLLGQPFALFQKGDGRGVENVLSGVWHGLDLRAFDYWYYDESTDSEGRTSRSYHRFDCAIVPIGAACPALSIGRETFFTRMADALSFHDIEFEDEAFNRAFNVRGNDRKFANDLVDARMMQWLLEHGADYGVEVVGNRVLVAGPKISPTELVQLIGRPRGSSTTCRRWCSRCTPSRAKLPGSHRRQVRGKEPASCGIWIVLLALILLVVFGGIASYNRFVSQRNLVRDAWANIDTELRRRYDLIPNLVETVKGYASHEREVFENVTKARAMATAATGSPAEQAAAEGPLVAALRQLFAVAENYPDLKANQNFLALQAELSNTEDRLQTARRFYNSNVRDYNRRVQSFPSNVIARSFGFT